MQLNYRNMQQFKPKAGLYRFDQPSHFYYWNKSMVCPSENILYIALLLKESMIDVNEYNISSLIPTLEFKNCQNCQLSSALRMTF